MDYILCSQAVIDHFKPTECSKPFRSGYDFDVDDAYYVAKIDVLEAETYYDTVIEPYNEKSRVNDIDFWFRTCNPGSMDDTKVTLKDCRKYGLFRAIEHATSLTNESNRAMVICNLAEKFNCTPIEFINKIA